MMSILFLVVFMIPMSLLVNWSWLGCLFLVVMSFFILINLNCYFYSCVGYNLGLDGASYCMIVLTLWIFSLMVLASYSLYFHGMNDDWFLLILVFLCLMLLVCFSVLDLILFYFCFEASIVPTYLLVVGWGYQSERLMAGFYLIFYTLAASLPMLLCIIYLGGVSCSFFISFIDSSLSFVVMLFMMMAFLVKMPMVFLHFWLPSAHVEAPISGSMVLAGILLKLGGYGLYRVLNFIWSVVVVYNYVYVIVSLVGGLYIFFLCLNQIDLKIMVAYSSISHMSLVLCGIMTLSSFGMGGSLLMMAGHGICSSGLFCLCNVLYERTFSRSVYVNSGVLGLLPQMSMCWFLLCAANMSSPFSLNLLGELLLLTSLLSWSGLLVYVLGMMLFMGCWVSIYIYSLVNHGNFSSGVGLVDCCLVREYLLMLLHLIPLNIFFLSVDFFVNWV